jgi:hypothetical protein
VAAFVVTGTGMFGPTGITEDTGGLPGLLAQVVTVGLWMAGVEWLARRHGIERLSRVGIQTAPAGVLPPSGS